MQPWTWLEATAFRLQPGPDLLPDSCLLIPLSQKSNCAVILKNRADMIDSGVRYVEPAPGGE